MSNLSIIVIIIELVIIVSLIYFNWRIVEEKKMVDSRKALESEYITVDSVKNSLTKKLVILDPGAYEDTEWGERLSLKVEMDGNKKVWRPNRDSIKNVQNVFKYETCDWVGKIIGLSVVSMKGKEMVIGIPTNDPVNSENQITK